MPLLRWFHFLFVLYHTIDIMICKAASTQISDHINRDATTCKTASQSVHRKARRAWKDEACVKRRGMHIGARPAQKDEACIETQGVHSKDVHRKARRA